MIDLMKFVEKDSLYHQRLHIALPWSVGEYTYATNGHIGVRVLRREDAAEDKDAPDFASVIIATHSGATDLRSVPAFEMPPLTKDCPDCNGLGIAEKCPDCDGKAFYDCHECGNETECKGCAGHGVHKLKTSEQADAIRGTNKERKCAHCNGLATVEREHNYARLTDRLWVNPKYLDLIRELPNAKIDFGADGASAIWFTFDGGVGVLMPMRVRDENAMPEEAIVLDLREAKEAAE